MALSSELISQFVKITNDGKNTKKESTVYGTTVTKNGTTYVKLDGSELFTPINTTADVHSGERVIVMIKNHTATITGNMSSPAARVTEVKQIKTDIEDASEVVNFLSGGKGIAFGKTAEIEDAAEFEFDAKFNSPVYGKALGMDRLPEIPANSDFNNYLEPGCYAVHKNADAETCSNIPIARAGRLEVWSSTGEGVRNEQRFYLRQRFIPYNSANAVWERDITRSSDNVWKYYDWWKSSLTPDASEFVYHKPKILWGDELTSGMYMTADHTAELKEAVSAQRHGIVLIFCAYNGTSDTNHSWQSFFVPKQLVALETSGHTFILGSGNFTYTGTKYLYIGDTSITGHADNILTGSNNGITYANDKFVLRYVIGV